MRKFIYKTLSLLLCSVMLCSTPVYAATESELKQQQKDTQKQLDNINSQMNQIESKKKSILSEINSLNSDLVNVALEIELLEGDIAAKQEEVEQAEEDYAAAKQKEEEQYEAMKMRIQYIYEEGDMDYLSLFIQAEDFADFINRADYAQEIQTKDRELVLAYQETKEQVAELLEELEQEKSDLEDLEAEYEDQKASLESSISKKKTEQADYESQLSAARQQASEYKQQLQKQQSELKKLEAERKKKEQEAAAAKAKEEAAKKATTSSPTSTKTETKTDSTAKPSNNTNTTASGGGSGSSIANYALQFVGNPYVMGGTSLTNGADCSGFIWSVYQHFGISLPRQSDAQGHSGKEVSYTNAQAGDIIYYGGHVGIYIGGGKIVHASTAKTGIKISTATYRTILSVRRYY